MAVERFTLIPPPTPAWACLVAPAHTSCPPRGHRQAPPGAHRAEGSTEAARGGDDCERWTSGRRGRHFPVQTLANLSAVQQ